MKFNEITSNMKVVFIIPGVGDSFYCGNCMRDNLHASALQKKGHEVIVIPLYLPLNKHAFHTKSPIFFPATTYYLAQKLFKRISMPKWLERFTGSDSMLKMASSMSGTTSTKGMEGMTLSMIHGEDPVFQKEVERLITWLSQDEKPHIIHLSSSLLIGIAKAIKEKMDTPVVCSLQDEEVWIDSMKEKYARLAWDSINKNLRFVDRLVTTSKFYKGIAEERLPDAIDIEVAYPGINLSKYNESEAIGGKVIGYYYRLNQENGLDILARAFVSLKRKNSIPGLRLKIGGGYTDHDKKFVKEVRQILAPVMRDVEFLDDYSMADHSTFYSSISLISVPLTFDEGVGLYLCEAFASGVPAVAPATGSFPEIIGEAGQLYHPNTPEKLSDALEKLLSDETLYKKAALKAKEKASEVYNDHILAGRLHEIYKQTFNND
ncbi:glycosyltransferase family 4 protein [Carboxylicivirga sp. RSCT41]|uniref:glycosyltransferase family 4 protein n=1 Tax=Carboxylicivirga agarovorans TaxID=3417570 RepID=UPI003D342F85